MGDDALQLAPEPNKKRKKKLHAHLNGTPPPPTSHNTAAVKEKISMCWSKKESKKEKSPKDIYV